MRAVNFGGNANNGASAGFLNSNVNNVPSNTNTNIGGRLCYYNIINEYLIFTLPLGKKTRILKNFIGRVTEDEV